MYQNMIRTAMDEIQNYTCIQFVEKTASDLNYVYIVNGKFCLKFTDADYYLVAIVKEKKKNLNLHK